MTRCSNSLYNLTELTKMLRAKTIKTFHGKNVQKLSITKYDEINYSTLITSGVRFDFTY